MVSKMTGLKLCWKLKRRRLIELLLSTPNCEIESATLVEWNSSTKRPERAIKLCQCFKFKLQAMFVVMDRYLGASGYAPIPLQLISGKKICRLSHPRIWKNGMPTCLNLWKRIVFGSLNFVLQILLKWFILPIAVSLCSIKFLSDCLIIPQIKWCSHTNFPSFLH